MQRKPLAVVARATLAMALAAGAIHSHSAILRAGEAHAPAPPTTALGAWHTVANYPILIESPAVASDGHFVYSAGGQLGVGGPTAAAFKYNPFTDSWTAIASLPFALQSTRSVYVPSTNTVYVFGGLNNGSVLNTTYRYHVATNTWDNGTTMPAGRYFPNVVYYPVTGKIYVIGGFNPAQNPDTQTWEYDPVADTWNTSRAAIPVPMAGSGTSLVGQYIYLAGTWTPSTTHYRYDIAGNSWTALAPVPVPMYVPAAGAIGFETFLVGGGNPFGPQSGSAEAAGSRIAAPDDSYNSTYIYNTVANTWSTGPPANVQHGFAGGTTVGSRLIVVGGYSPGVGDTDVVEMNAMRIQGTGRLIGSTLTIGYAPHNYGYLAANIVNYAFLQSRTVASDFAIFQTHDPWSDLVVKTAITNAGHSYTVFTPAQLSGFPFSNYGVIVLNWDDHFLTDFQTPYNAAISALQTYVQQGGVLWVQAAIHGTTGHSFTMPLGGTETWDLSPSDFVVDPGNPMVAGGPNPITGNSASHATYSSLPVVARIVARKTDVNGPPVLYEIRLGRARYDTNNDVIADRTVFRPSNGVWYTALSTGGATAMAWGVSGDVDVMGDYDGDGKADVAVFRPSSGQWFIVQSSSGTTRIDTWGVNNDIPMSGDVDGDGKDDLVIFRPGAGAWFFKNSGGGTSVLGWGLSTDQPLMGDFDGDGRSDAVAYRPSTGVWYINLSGGGVAFVGWGTAGDIPVVGNWDGDQLADEAVYRPSSNVWIVRTSSGAPIAVGWGASSDIPVSGDFDGDGRSDFTVWRPSTGVWFTLFAAPGGGTGGVAWGIPGDKPVGRLPGT